MTPSPIPRVLFIFRKHNIRALLIGGQAAILYGGAEFSRDIDFAVAVSSRNLHKVRKALDELGAEQIFFPSLSAKALRKGHACHFRCRDTKAFRLRIDIIGKLRGTAPFKRLWKRRQIVRLPNAGTIAVLSLPDLVQSKKTQRDKDWLMIRRLVEADILRHAATNDRVKIKFWLLECRTADLLCELAYRYSDCARRLIARRPLLKHALRGNTDRVESLLRDEEMRERAADKKYWKPLRKDLEEMRRCRNASPLTDS